MAATYRAVRLTKKGGPEVLQIVELPLDPPGPGQLRVRVRALTAQPKVIRRATASIVNIARQNGLEYIAPANLLIGVRFNGGSPDQMDAKILAERRQEREQIDEAIVAL